MGGAPELRSAAVEVCMRLTRGRRLIRRLQNSYGTPLNTPMRGGQLVQWKCYYKSDTLSTIGNQRGVMPGESAIRKETKVYLLDCGTMALDQTYMFMDAGLTGPAAFSGLRRSHRSCRKGKFIFDTGFDSRVISAERGGLLTELRGNPQLEQTIPGQLSVLGVRPSRNYPRHQFRITTSITVAETNTAPYATTICHRETANWRFSRLRGRRKSYRIRKSALHPTSGSGASRGRVRGAGLFWCAGAAAGTSIRPASKPSREIRKLRKA